VAESLHDVIGCRAMFATHYHELTELAATRTGLQNWCVTAREYAGDIVFLHKLTAGAASRSYGVACARLAGLPEPVLARAKVILNELEQSPGAATRGSSSRDKPSRVDQLDLFGQRTALTHPALQTLRAVDVDRLTPLEALQLIASLKTLTDSPQ
jgi:DNA mismatch repair protein MutS